MHLSSSSAVGVRFLTSVREGRGLNRSAREVGIGKETGYRWLREAYVTHRRGGRASLRLCEKWEMALIRVANRWEATAGAGHDHRWGRAMSPFTASCGQLKGQPVHSGGCPYVGPL